MIWSLLHDPVFVLAAPGAGLLYPLWIALFRTPTPGPRSERK